jgi:hypothetical protein
MFICRAGDPCFDLNCATAVTASVASRTHLLADRADLPPAKIRQLWHNLARFTGVTPMIFETAKTLGCNLILVLMARVFAYSVCPVDDVMVKGTIEQAPRHAKVRVQLVYARDMQGESADTTLDGSNFTLSVDFLTQSRGPLVNGSFEKCGRKPESVIVTLVDHEGTREYDRVALQFPKNFTKATPSTYLSSGVLLKGP